MAFPFTFFLGVIMNVFAIHTAICVIAIVGLSYALSFLERFLNGKASTEEQRDANSTIIRTVTFVTMIALAWKFGPAVVICAIIIERALTTTRRAYAAA